MPKSKDRPRREYKVRKLDSLKIKRKSLYDFPCSVDPNKNPLWKIYQVNYRIVRTWDLLRLLKSVNKSLEADIYNLVFWIKQVETVIKEARESDNYESEDLRESHIIELKEWKNQFLDQKQNPHKFISHPHKVKKALKRELSKRPHIENKKALNKL